MIGIIRLDKRVLRQPPCVTVGYELVESAEDLSLLLEEVDQLQRPARHVEVIELCGVPRVHEPFVDALVFLIRISQLHPDMSERRAVMRERPVAKRRARD